jgi:hypothetical protein
MALMQQRFPTSKALKGPLLRSPLTARTGFITGRAPSSTRFQRCRHEGALAGPFVHECVTSLAVSLTVAIPEFIQTAILHRPSGY